MTQAKFAESHAGATGLPVPAATGGVRVLVTGATGFLGKRTCKALTEAGHRVWALSRNGADSAGDSEGLIQHSAHLLDEPLPEGLVDWEPQAVVHLAWSGIPDYGLACSLANLNSQVGFVDRLVEIPTVRHLLIAGTCFEYGATVGACSEDAVVPATTFIGWAKRSLHEYVLLATADRPIEVAWFRVFYAYGPGQRPGGLLPSMLREASHGDQLDLRTPDAARDFVYVDDVARAFRLAVEQKDASGTFNIGSGRLTALTEIRDRVWEIVSGGHDQPRFTSLEGGEPFRPNGAFAVLDRIGECLGWSPVVDLDEGILRTWRDLVAHVDSTGRSDKVGFEESNDG